MSCFGGYFNLRSFTFREVLHPIAEGLFGLAVLSHGYCLLVLHRVLKAPASFHMKGYPPENSAGMILMLAVLALLGYSLSFVGSATQACYRENIEALSDDERLELFRNKRGLFAVIAVLLSVLSWFILLGITYGTGGFEWNRRWP